MTSNLVPVLEILLVVGFIGYRQMATRSVKGDLLRLPVIIGGLGLLNLLSYLAQSAAPTLAQWATLVAGLALAAAIAVPRARSVRLWQGSDGRWMRRGTAVTPGWWVTLLLSHAVLIVVAALLFGGVTDGSAVGGGLDAASVPLLIGFSLGVQGWPLERRLAVIAPERRQARSLAIS